jgi:mRNA-degrading endonuclease RelE of RelBE toxin-antitoxin system
MLRYQLLLEADVQRARKHLSGDMRQRIKQLIEDLADEPRPPRSSTLDVAGMDLPPQVELRRLRLDPWRLIYAVNDAEAWVWVLALQRRPPYDYDDLERLAEKLV